MNMLANIKELMARKHNINTDGGCIKVKDENRWAEHIEVSSLQ